MEFATAALSAIGIGGGSAAAGGAAAAAGAPLNLVAAGSGGSMFAGILQGGLGVLGAMGALRAGQAQADAYRSQAADTRLQVGQEDVNATLKETSMRKALIRSLGERDVAYAASGVDLSFGTPATARAAAIADASEAMSLERQNTDMRKSQLRAKADTYDALASDAEDAGLFKAIGSIGAAGLGILGRG
jgi:hypothetical protein